MTGLGGQQFINLGKLLNHWNDRDQIWSTYTYSPGKLHRLTKLTPRASRGICRGSGGHKYKNVGKMPNSCTDWDHIWHTYAYSSGNGHELNINHGAWGVRGSSIHKSGKASKPLDRSGSNLAHVYRFTRE